MKVFIRGWTNWKKSKQCGDCSRNTLLPYENEWTCFPSGFNLKKHELNNFQRKKITNGLKYAEHKTICICVDEYKFYESNDFDKIYEILSTLKNKKLKINITLFEK